MSKTDLISCPKCHGAGKYLPWDDTEWVECNICHGMGKITVEFYETLQSHTRKMRGEEDAEKGI